MTVATQYEPIASAGPDGPAWLRRALDANAAAHRLPGLDGLRAVAIAAVMLSHFLPFTFPGGFLGIDLFFVISGYIITERLLREFGRVGTISLAAFYQRRIRRLWPALWLLVAVVTLIGVALGPAWKSDLTPRSQILDSVYALTSTMNLVRAFALWGGGKSFLGPTWSLAAEEQFYLLWPLCLVLALRVEFGRRLPAALLVAIAVVTTWRIRVGSGAATVAAVQRVYFGPDKHADTVLAGCLLALLGMKIIPSIVLRLWIVPAAIIGVMVEAVRLDSPWMPAYGYSLILVCAVWLTAASVENRDRLRFLLGLEPLQWMGLRSYSLYLWHAPILALVEMTRVQLRYAVPLALPPILIAADLSYRFVERRFARLRPA